MTNRDTFAIALATLTHLDVNVCQAWAIEEEGWDATEASDLGNQNWLNIGYFDSGPGQIAFASRFHTPAGGAAASAEFLAGTWGGASQGIRQILQTAGESPAIQIERIGNSGWATNPDYATQIQSVYDQVFARGMQLVLPLPPPPPAPVPWQPADEAKWCAEWDTALTPSLRPKLRFLMHARAAVIWTLAHKSIPVNWAYRNRGERFQALWSRLHPK